jgi:hypothetical protein
LRPRAILRWASERGLGGRWGKGAKFGTFYPVIEHGEHAYLPITVYTSGKVEVNFNGLKSQPPFDHEAKRREFWTHLNEIEAVGVADRLESWPSFSLTVLSNSATQQLIETLEWFAQEATQT